MGQESAEVPIAATFASRVWAKSRVYIPWWTTLPPAHPLLLYPSIQLLVNVGDCGKEENYGRGDYLRREGCLYRVVAVLGLLYLIVLRVLEDQVLAGNA